MLITITWPDGTVQKETAFGSIEALKKALFTHVPEGVKIAGEELPSVSVLTEPLPVKGDGPVTKKPRKKVEG